MGFMLKPLALVNFAKCSLENALIALYGFDRCPPQDTSQGDLYFEAAFASTPFGKWFIVRTM